MRLFLSIVRCLTAALCCWCSSVPTAVAQPRVPRNDTLPQAVVREWSARDPRRSNTPQQVLRMQDLARTGATDMTAVLPEKAKTAMLATIPMAAPGQPEDVARAAAFFARPESAYITGQVLCVDGGMAV